MTALTPAERQELLAQIDSLNQRAVEKDREVRALRVRIEHLTNDVANGVAGAKSKAMKLDDEARGAQLEVEACERAKASAEARYEADRPFREEEARAEQMRVRAAAVAVSFDKAKAADALGKQWAAAISDHQDSLIDVVQAGGNPNLTHSALPQYWIMPALAAAGVPGLPPNLGQAPATLESYMRQILR